MRIFKPLAAFALAVAFLACLNAALTFALVPYGSKSELAWTDYSDRAAMTGTDTVIVGTSLVQSAIVPDELDELYGCKSFCLATPSQTLEESFVAIETAYEDYGITRAILGVSSVDLQAADPPSLGSAFLFNRSRVASPAQNAQAAWQVLARYGGAGQSGSINALFPWFYNHVAIGASGIGENVRARLGMTVYEAASVADPVGHYVGKGHTVYESVLDYDGDAAKPFFSDDREDGTTETAVNADRARTLGDISAYCDEHGIELVALSVPLPAYDVVDGEGYYELRDNVARAFAALGRDYRDFNFARPELFEPHPEYFQDTLHMNEEGARAFTESFARFLLAADAGEDLDAFFWSDEEERASIDYISAVFADVAVDAEGVHVAARAVAGTGVEAEYQLCALDAETQTWQVVADWTADSDFDYAPAERGVVDLRVNARKVGSQSECDRYRTLHAYY